MNEELQKLGQKFRQKREEMHLSLKEVENATSIRQNHLQSIEEGDTTHFISPVYTMGFIKQYATFLGFDGEKLIKEHPQIFKTLGGERQTFDYGIGTLEVRGAHPRGVKKAQNVFWIGVALFVLTVAWYFAKWIGVL